MKLRFSLRGLLILLTVVTIFFGVRLNQRGKLQSAATEIQNSDGTVYYRAQSPYQVGIPQRMPPAYPTVEVPYIETLPDGRTQQKFRTELAHRNFPSAILVDEVRTQNSGVPQFNLAAFLLGTHDDVDVQVVSIPASALDQDMANTLARFNNLESIVLCVEERYFSVKSSNRSTPEQRAEDLRTLGQDLQRATTILKKALPHVDLYQGIVSER